MRALGFILVATSLALSVGGVSLRKQDPGQQTSVRPDTADDSQGTCSAAEPETVVRRTRIKAPQVTRPIVGLGNRGFNYSRPGDPVPTEVRPASDAPAAPSE